MRAILFMCLIALSPGPVFAEEDPGLSQPKGSFQVFVGPRVFSSRDLGTGTNFTRIAKPEVGIKISPYIFDFGLEPLISMSYITNSSKAAGSMKNTYHLFNLASGLRYRFFNSNVFPVIPYVEANLSYRLMRLKTRGGADSSNRHGGELAAQAGGGLKFSFTSRDAGLRNEMRDVWGLKDYGLDLYGLYETRHFLRSGKALKALDQLDGFSFGAGLYLDW